MIESAEKRPHFTHTGDNELLAFVVRAVCYVMLCYVWTHVDYSSHTEFSQPPWSSPEPHSWAVRPRRTRQPAAGRRYVDLFCRALGGEDDDDVPAIGGNRMATTPRNRSGEHILGDYCLGFAYNWSFSLAIELYGKGRKETYVVE